MIITLVCRKDQRYTVYCADMGYRIYDSVSVSSYRRVIELARRRQWFGIGCASSITFIDSSIYDAARHYGVRVK